MRYYKVLSYKMMRSYWFLIMILAPIIYGICLFLYLKRYDNPTLIFYDYTIYFNCAIPFGISLMISLYIKYEEQIGHFNHILKLPDRAKWGISLIVISILSIMCSTFISCFPLWLLIGQRFLNDILLYFILTIIFSLTVIIILWFIAIKINANICLGAGVFFSIFLIYFGAQSLGDSIWQYIPLLYGTRYIYQLMANHHEFTFLIISLYVIINAILLGVFVIWFNKWEGRVINE
ncbi:MFS family permease [Scopulibacillus daqui]|uniref:MFS family permease n=1 Tax=Scopulibacillus daqui TaxID=1469162 RepID=A0ABS2Q0Z8_9BACL|nr:MFS family permease [Scopulibacillus daqui]